MADALKPPDIVRFVQQMLEERGFDLVNPVMVEGEGPRPRPGLSRCA